MKKGGHEILILKKYKNKGKYKSKKWDSFKIYDPNWPMGYSSIIINKKRTIAIYQTATSESTYKSRNIIEIDSSTNIDYFNVLKMGG
jgi:hypothetical protein